MKVKINTTLVDALLMLVLSAATWFAIPLCIAEFASSTDLGPRAFPQLICAAIAILSALQLVLCLTGVQKAHWMEFELSARLPVCIAMALSLAAVICALFFNVLLAGVICGILFLVILKVKDFRYYLAVAVTGGLLFVLMKFVMHIRF